jgi:hypothetical protein
MAVHPVAESRLHVDEQVLVVCFGRDLLAVRHERQLRLALRKAGYPAALAGHLIRHSPLLVRQAGHCYRLRRCDENEAGAPRHEHLST